MSHLATALRKELLLQWRSRTQFFGVFIFGATSLLLFSFVTKANSDVLQKLAPGFLWIALLLSSTLTLAESFQTELEQRALEGLLLLPASDRAIYYGKAIANWLQLTVLGVGLLPIMTILYNTPLEAIPKTIGIVMLGAAGLSAPGTLYAGISSQARAKQTLLPLLLFPLIVPVLISAGQATAYTMDRDPMGQTSSWLTLLFLFDVIYWSLCGLLFGRIVED